MSSLIRDVSDWSVMSPEALGDDPKDWLTSPDLARVDGEHNWWIYKPVKYGTAKAGDGTTYKYRRFDDASEWIACQLGGLLELPVARVETVRKGADAGIISHNVIPSGWERQEGDVLLSDIPGYEPSAPDERATKDGHSLGNIQHVLSDARGPLGSNCGEWPAFDVFVGFLIFDAWIANTDRHARNWAGVIKGRKTRLAASFDHGSALGSGLTEQNLETRDPVVFAGKGLAREFDTPRRTTLVDLAHQAVDMASARSSEWLSRLAEIDHEAVVEVLDGVRLHDYSQGLSVARRMFLAEVLSENRRRLTA